jgi:hypothetical protein
VTTSELADKLERTVLGQGEPWDYVREAAARLRELEALEPVRRVLAAVDEGVLEFRVKLLVPYGPVLVESPKLDVFRDTATAALAVLSEALGEGEVRLPG